MLQSAPTRVNTTKWAQRSNCVILELEKCILIDEEGFFYRGTNYGNVLKTEDLFLAERFDDMGAASSFAQMLNRKDARGWTASELALTV